MIRSNIYLNVMNKYFGLKKLLVEKDNKKKCKYELVFLCWGHSHQT